MCHRRLGGRSVLRNLEVQHSICWWVLLSSSAHEHCAEKAVKGSPTFRAGLQRIQSSLVSGQEGALIVEHERMNGAGVVHGRNPDF